MIEEIKDHQFSETESLGICVVAQSQSSLRVAIFRLIVVISAKVNKLGSSIE
jgi:hypothetical protein